LASTCCEDIYNERERAATSGNERERIACLSLSLVPGVPGVDGVDGVDVVPYCGRVIVDLLALANGTKSS